MQLIMRTRFFVVAMAAVAFFTLVEASGQGGSTQSASATETACSDTDANCASWARTGECSKNPGFMHTQCARSCGTCGSGSGDMGMHANAAAAEAWELENLEEPYKDSVIRDVDMTLLERLAERRGEWNPLIVWFFAPWCKQSKLIRPALEEAARLAPPNVHFARLNTVLYPEAKELYGVYSYPSFKVFRGARQRWVAVPRNRSVDVLLRIANEEAGGSFAHIDSAAEMRALLSLKQEGVSGSGEVFVIAHLDPAAIACGEASRAAAEDDTIPSPASHSDPDSPTASGTSCAAHAAFRRLAAGCSVLMSPMSFYAISNASLLAAAGLPPVPLNHVAVVKLFQELAHARTEDKQVPRLSVLPLLKHDRDTNQQSDHTDLPTSSDNDAEEREQCAWLRSHRVPLLVDFKVDPSWAKRASYFDFMRMHALVFVRPSQEETAQTVSDAVAAFPRGSVLVVRVVVADLDSGNGGMAKRFGVSNLFEMPRLVFLDQTLSNDVNRQRPYKGQITREGVQDFLVEAGLQMQDGENGARQAVKEPAAAKEEL